MKLRKRSILFSLQVEKEGDSEEREHSSALTKIMNASSLDEGTDEEDADYQPRLKMNSQKYVYHEPRIGDQYQVDAANIPEVHATSFQRHLIFNR